MNSTFKRMLRRCAGFGALTCDHRPQLSWASRGTCSIELSPKPTSGPFGDRSGSSFAVRDLANRALIRDPGEDALSRHLRERARGGTLKPSRLEAAARLGYRPAEIASGIESAPIDRDLDDPSDDLVVGALRALGPKKILEWTLAYAGRFEIPAQGPFVDQCGSAIETAREVWLGRQEPRAAREVLDDLLGAWDEHSRTFEVSALAYVARGACTVAGLLRESLLPGSDPSYERLDEYRWLSDPDRRRAWRGQTRTELVLGFMAQRAEHSGRAAVWRWKPGPQRRGELAAQREGLVAMLLR